MQAIILAAGKSTRTYPLTLTRPKPLLKAANRTILEHNLDQLNGIADEVMIVVNYMKGQIIQTIGTKYKNLKIKYVEQNSALGTGHALMQAEKFFKDKFIVMNGDDFYSQRDIRNCIKHDYCVLAKEVKDPKNFGVFVVKNNSVQNIIEKPKKPISNLANTGLYVFKKDIFKKKLKKSKRGEYEITEYIIYLIKKKIKVACENVSDYWFPIVYPWDLLDANSHFLYDLIQSDVRGEIEDFTKINGNLVTGKGTRILNGVYIEGNVIIGEFCKIGPNCYIRGNTAIGNRCHIGQSVEIKNSIIMDNSKIPHLSYVGDSVIGENVNFGAGTITANLKHDNSNVVSFVKTEKVDTGRRKLGAIVGDNVHTAINTSFYPGRKVWPGKTTLPGEAVKKDIK